ncbi:hypothetical protein M407DRAFT_247087 [Tulasnella calospora MUT 4182]|uniref:Uncharacterized protein n=1 Tax=Tulasnella calospora MUT 4182 TaxID=1051891 RepID=A0A0C3Q0V4_9AGAM|nr:hypothetical protein M407DRAFT_247087 [Tulasnella calospora MUT 4182]
MKLWQQQTTSRSPVTDRIPPPSNSIGLVDEWTVQASPQVQPHVLPPHSTSTALSFCCLARRLPTWGMMQSSCCGSPR